VDVWVSQLDTDPFAQFERWLEDAAKAGVRAPETMTLATATPDGRPSARMVLLKGAGPAGFVFFTNHESRKATELDDNPRAALVLYWQALDRQVRIEGRVERVDEETSLAYFATRPRGAQLAAWSSPQSHPVAGRDELVDRYADTERRFAGADVPLPPFWGGYRVVPETIEFWQGRENRFHDRLRYSRDAAGWSRTRLGP
jgi:pyridoxamine 5'-phosphate oxidase